jgi:hypothetical protein
LPCFQLAIPMPVKTCWDGTRCDERRSRRLHGRLGRWPDRSCARCRNSGLRVTAWLGWPNTPFHRRDASRKMRPCSRFVIG